ncbi:MAG: ABC transporter substrate-binding protein [Gammaproteobacteria bacterium]|nr:ABC transporter substrate-binding protein [Gammaproteobacteria bacterium]NIR82585.1 ABC transporter substrate-binding protein [Gammaproteobacteria bacterium]NIR88788.1 ABC transporter substrate-binding protein [Gammaproteobacteria bacterium]NIV73993.1 ABC transporter substrate-binding protein [Gammaproteobacteria bacterium]
MRRRRFLAGLLGVSGTALVGEPGRAATPGTVTVGGTVSLSGRFAAFGPPVQRALRLWREQLNAGGGLGGARVRLALEDDASDPDIARRRFQRLAPETDLLIAPYGSWLTRAVLPEVETAGRPCVAPTAGDRALWAQRRLWTAQLLNPSDTMLNGVVALASRAGLGTAAFLYREDAFSRTVVAGAADRARALGLEVRANLTYRNEPEARKHARALSEARPQLVAGMGFRPGGAGSGFLDDALMLLDALGAAGVDAPLLCLGIGASDRRFAGQAGAAAEGVVGSTGWRTYLRTPGNSAFVSAFRARWGETPDVHAAQGYAAAQVLARAWRRGASNARAPTPSAVRDALFGLDVETVFGRFRVNERGLQTGKTNALVQWRDGEPVVIGPGRYAEGAFVPRAGQGRSALLTGARSEGDRPTPPAMQ